MKLFFDTKCIGLHHDTILISVGVVSEEGHTFYAELNDYDETQIDEGSSENVIKNLVYNANNTYYLKYDCKNTDGHTIGTSVQIKGSRIEIRDELVLWLSQFDSVEARSDCLDYDWVLYNQLFGHTSNIPENV